MYSIERSILTILINLLYEFSPTKSVVYLFKKIALLKSTLFLKLMPMIKYFLWKQNTYKDGDSKHLFNYEKWYILFYTGKY